MVAIVGAAIMRERVAAAKKRREEAEEQSVTEELGALMDLMDKAAMKETCTLQVEGELSLPAQIRLEKLGYSFSTVRGSLAYVVGWEGVRPV